MGAFASQRPGPIAEASSTGLAEAEPLEETPLGRAAALIGAQTAELVDVADFGFGELSRRVEQLQLLVLSGVTFRAPEAWSETAAAGAPRSPPSIVLPPPRAAPAIRVDPPVVVAAWSTREDSGWRAYARDNIVGFRSPRLRLSTGGLFRVVLELAADQLVAGELAVLDRRGQWVGRRTTLRAPTTTLTLFIPHTARAVRVLMVGTEKGDTSAPPFRSARVEALDLDAFYQSHAHTLPAPVVASIVSTTDGAATLRDAVESLLLQCDRVRVTLAGYAQVPAFLERDRIDVRRCMTLGDAFAMGATGWPNMDEPAAFRILASDRVVVQPDYCETMLTCQARHDYRAVTGVGGFGQDVVGAEQPRGADTPVELLLAGATMVHESCLPLAGPDLTLPGLQDAMLARTAQAASVPLIDVSRPAGWVRLQASERPARPVNAVLRSAVLRSLVRPATERPYSGEAALLPDLFDRVVVLNRDDQFDRWERLRNELAAIGVTAERSRMVDPKWEEVEQAFAAYAGARRGRRPIASAADWAYLLSWERAALRAVRDGVHALLLLHDDVRLAPDAATVFAAAARQLPGDWLCLQLGAAGAVVGTRGPPLRLSGAVPLGSFAIGLRAASLPVLLDRIGRMDRPLGEGPLAAIHRLFAGRCFQCVPPVILSPQAGSAT